MLGQPLATTRRHEVAAGFGLWLLLACAWLLLSPGLGGEFLFDDSVNLSGLTSISADPSLYRAIQYVSSGVSSTLGRPLALTSFALQHHSWPGHPQDFIHVNILLHLLNGALLFWLLIMWRRITAAASHNWLIPLAITALWVLSPLQTNAVLYVVQRMTVLSGTFVLLGLLLHLKGRQAGLDGRTTTAFVVMTAGTFAGLGLGTLAKESAALFPLMLLVTESTLLRTVPRPHFWQPWSLGMIGLPVLLLAGYLAYLTSNLPAQYEFRPFNLQERLSSQPRILFMYLRDLVLPPLYSIRILYDDLTLSKTLVSPWTTLPALLGWLALVVAAFRLRIRAPEFSFAVLWFVSAHLLESTFLPLEPAFLHRNYIAIIGPLVFLVSAYARLTTLGELRRIRPILAIGAAVYVLLFAFSLAQSSKLWGDAKEQSRHWVIKQPDSRRAILIYTSYLFRFGLTERGTEVLHNAISRWPDDSAMRLSLIHKACFFPGIEIPELHEVQAALLRHDSYISLIVGLLNEIVTAAENGKCRRFALWDLETVLDTALESPNLRPARHNLLILRSRLTELQGNRVLAMEYLDRAIQARPRPDLIEQAVYWSLQARDAERAREYLAIAESSPRISRIKRWSHRREINALRELIERYESRTGHPGHR